MNDEWYPDGTIFDESGLPMGRAGKPIPMDLHKMATESDLHLLAGVGPDAPTVVAANGAKQSHTPYRCDLLPAKALLHIANILDAGARKYGDNNWRGLPMADHLNHALVHIYAGQAGDIQDDHLGHAACRLLMCLETYLMGGGK